MSDGVEVENDSMPWEEDEEEDDHLLPGVHSSDPTSFAILSSDSSDVKDAQPISIEDLDGPTGIFSSNWRGKKS